MLALASRAATGRSRVALQLSALLRYGVICGGQAAGKRDRHP